MQGLGELLGGVWWFLVPLAVDVAWDSCVSGACGAEAWLGGLASRFRELRAAGVGNGGVAGLFMRGCCCCC